MLVALKPRDECSKCVRADRPTPGSFPHSKDYKESFDCISLLLKLTGVPLLL